MNIKRSFTAALFVAATAMPLAAQQNQPDFTITPDERQEVIEGSIARLKEAYVFPETARRMEAAVRERMAKGEDEVVAPGGGSGGSQERPSIHPS